MQEILFDNGISSRFKQLRVELKLTQAEFAGKLGVEQAAVSKIENNHKQLDIRIMNALIEIFHININWLLTGVSSKYVIEQVEPQVLDPDPEIADLMKGAQRVLTSGNPIAFDALERNIRYFDHAIAAEKRADEMAKEIQEVKDDFKIMKAEMDRLKRENLRIDMDAEEQSSKKKVV